MRALSDMQASMLVHEALTGRPIYNMPLVFELSGALAVDDLAKALQHVIGRHPVLSATYTPENAVVQDPAVAPVELQLRRAADDADEERAELAAFFEEPFDLSRQLPIRARLSSRSATEHTLAVNVHHVAGDSWSLTLLLNELSHTYRCYRQGTEPTLAPGPDFFALSADEHADPGDDAGWWAATLNGLQPQPYPRGTAPPETQRAATLAADLNLGGRHTRRLRRFAQRNRVSPATVLFSIVSRLTAAGAATESVVGLPAASRGTALHQQTMGPLLNMLPIRTKWPADASLEALVEAHARAIADALAHQGTPYSRILKAAGTRRRPGAAPLFLHLVNVDNEVPRLNLSGVRAQPRPYLPRWTTFPALWQFNWSSVGNIGGALHASADAFTPGQVADLVSAFRTDLSRLLDEPAATAGKTV